MDERLTGLVEGDVAVLANAAEEEFDSAVGLDLLLVRLALLDEVLGVPVKDVHLRGRNIHCARAQSRQSRSHARCEGADAPCEKNSRNMKVW